MFQKILLGIALLCVAALGFIAITETKRANYLQNFIRTEAARRARWNRKEPEEEEEEQPTEEQLAEMDRLMNHIEKRAEELKTQNANDSQNL